MRNVLLLGVSALSYACSSYKQNIMFKTPEGFTSTPLGDRTSQVIQDYAIQKNDQLSIEVFSNNGERIIDPNPELTDSGLGRTGEKDMVNYLVTADGQVRLPMVNEIKIDGLTLRQAEVLIQNEYARYFKDPYVVMRFTNKRAILLGASGGQVIPLDNQNVRLTEVLALGKGLDNNARAHNIRLLRGEEVMIIDMSTIAGYKAGDVFIQPGDIIYVEPIRRPFTEAIRENGTFISIFVSLASLVLIIINVR